MVTILYRYAKYKGYDTTKIANLSKYSDSASISPWQKKQCSGAMLKKYIDGNTDGTLAPTGNALRAK